MGAYHTGSCFWPTDGGAVLWTALAWVAGELCTLGVGPLAICMSTWSLWVSMGVGGFGSLLFLASVRHFVLLLSMKSAIQIKFDLI